MEMRESLLKSIINKQLQTLSMAKGYHLLLVYKLRDKYYRDYVLGKDYFLEYVDINGVEIFMHQSLKYLFKGDISKLSFSIRLNPYGKVPVYNILKYHFEDNYKMSLIPGQRKVYELGWEIIEKLFEK